MTHSSKAVVEEEASVEAEVEAGVFPLEAEDVAAVDFKYFAISMEIRYILLFY